MHTITRASFYDCIGNACGREHGACVVCVYARVCMCVCGRTRPYDLLFACAWLHALHRGHTISYFEIDINSHVCMFVYLFSPGWTPRHYLRQVPGGYPVVRQGRGHALHHPVGAGKAENYYTPPSTPLLPVYVFFSISS